MHKTGYVLITLALVAGIGIVFFGGSKNSAQIGESAQNVEIKDGVQYITVSARGGYSPQVSTAKAGIPTKLIVKTNGTYDCSASLAIRSIGYQKVLPQTGEDITDIGIPKAGQPLQGVCSMGMYNFLVNFN